MQNLPLSSFDSAHYKVLHLSLIKIGNLFQADNNSGDPSPTATAVTTTSSVDSKNEPSRQRPE